MKALIEKRQFGRFQLLYELYKNNNTAPDFLGMGYAIGIKNGVFKEASEYLLSEKLITQTKSTAKLTHEGKKIVEWAIMNPKESSALFPPFADMGIEE